MKRKLTALGIFGVVALFSVTTVLATEASSTSNSTSNFGVSNFTNNLKEQKEKLGEVREQMKEKVASKAAELRLRRRGYIKETLSKIIRLLSNEEQRLNAVADKIHNRLEKAKVKGVDVTVLQVALDSCKQNKTSVDAAIANAKSKGEAINASVVENNGQVKDAREAILAARKELVNYRQCLSNVTKQAKLISRLKEATESAR